MKTKLFYLLLLTSTSLFAQINTRMFTVGGFGIGASCDQFEQQFQNDFDYAENHFYKNYYLHYKMQGELIVGCDKASRKINSIQYYLGHPEGNSDFSEGFQYVGQLYDASDIRDQFGTPEVTSHFQGTTYIWNYRQSNELTISVRYGHIKSISVGTLN